MPRIARVLFAAVAAALAGVAAPSAAFDFFDGRLEAHGYFEQQVRTIARDFDPGDDFDLTQWWNILSLEIEGDLAPNGFGPFDVLQAFGRVEVRYDCVWTRACGLFSGADAYGDRAGRLPGRLADGRRAGFRSSGAVFNGDVRAYRDISRAELPFEFSRFDPADPSAPATDVAQPPRPNGSRKPSPFFTIEGIDTLYDNVGPDLVFGPNPFVGEAWAGKNDDPAPFYFARQERKCEFTYRRVHGSQGGVGVQILPWNPKCKVEPNGVLSAQPDPLSSQDYNFVLEFVRDSTALESLMPNPNPAGPVGFGALPMRPQALNRATDPLTGAPLPLVSKSQSQGIYFPNAELVRQFQGDGLDDFDQNFRQAELEWNRGASQQDEKELKEAYLDIEMFDSRLWLRAGKQQIVWGKTELFRNQDQWNPQDLALASLPSLEESRIALWSLRGVWSFYDVGPLEDVRLELAGTFDQFEPTDLGRCGEPYAPNPVCNKTMGLFVHGLTGFGVAGEVRPDDPWDDVEGIEVGARLEWRWERFSFAVTDYWGFTDLPYQDALYVYSRNVDPATGIPRRQMSTGSCTSPAFEPDPNQPNTNSGNGYVPAANADPACLTARNALAEQSTNQQLFRLICATSIGFTALDPTACGQSVFNSFRLAENLLVVSSTLSSILAGDRLFVLPQLVDALSAEPLNLAAIQAQRLATQDPWQNPKTPAPGANASQSPSVRLIADPNDGGNGGEMMELPTAAEDLSYQAAPPTLINFNLFINPSAGLQPYLTDQQEALLGCGPFYGTRCDVEGIDLMNAEASALFQSFPGFEGTLGDWDTRDAGVAQPGTVGFAGGTPCGRGENGSFSILPGCRGPGDPGYDPNVDGSTTGPLQLHPFTGQQWQNEMAMVSWNLLMGLVAFSGTVERTFAPNGDVLTTEPLPDDQIPIAFFNPNDPFRTDGCSIAKTQYCSSVQALFQVTGVQRNTRRAGGNGQYGRRDFVWHGGKDVLLRYEKRNILGFSADFAEDVTKSSWSFELTWQDDLTFADNDTFDGTRNGIDTYNLTISVDRPTFINFLNAGRTFFLNTQLFTQYVDGYRRSFPSAGPWNFLWVGIIQTGYFDDRLQPQMTLVYDVDSNSGGFIPQTTYRFSANFSATFGLALFVGREEERPMAITPVSLANRNGRHAYKDFTENGLSAIRDRDEIFLRLRYTF